MKSLMKNFSFVFEEENYGMYKEHRYPAYSRPKSKHTNWY